MPDTLVMPQYVNFSFGSERKTKPRVLRASFGNGYKQMSGDGFNTLEREYSVTFENLTRANSAYLESFFKARKGYISFYYTAPGEASPTMWICKEWSTAHTDALTDSMQCEWEEIFAP